jgi:hypothetical protein
MFSVPLILLDIPSLSRYTIGEEETSASIA